MPPAILRRPGDRLPPGAGGSRAGAAGPQAGVPQACRCRLEVVLSRWGSEIRQRVERPSVPDRGQDVVELPILGTRIPDVVRDDRGEPEGVPECHRLRDQPVIVRKEVMLEFEDVPGPRDPSQPPCGAESVPRPGARLPGPRPEAAGRIPRPAARERHDTLRVLREERVRHRGAALDPARFARLTRPDTGSGTPPRHAQKTRCGPRAAFPIPR